MQRRFRQVDVFTAKPYLGNPVAVVLDGDGLSDERMQAIARWTNLSETTFVCTPDDARADYRLRIFCPSHEMRFAGHPTIGSAHALMASGFQPKQTGVLVQECGVGLVQLRIKGNGGPISVALPAAEFKPVDPSLRSDIEESLGTGLLDAPVIVDLGVAWMIAEVASGEVLRRLRPNMAAIASLARRARANGLTVFGRDGAGIEVRSFAPHEGTPEDPVCGSGNGAVAYYLRERGQTKDYVARQGCCLGRDGHVHVHYDGDAIWVGGQAVNCIEGTINT